MKKLLLATVVAATSAVLPAAPAMAQSSQDLLNDHKTPGDVLVYGMGYSAQRYSALAKINKSNVKKLVPMWSKSTQASSTKAQRW